jgi:hypothetical protein
MSRLPSVSHHATLNQKSQEAALMMAANQSLTHSPPTSWRCYSAAGAEAAGRSNLASGLAGAAAIVAYMIDSGANNTAVGHRRWILFPPQREIGTGSTSRYHSMYVIGSAGSRSGSPELVPWPNAGFVPYQLVYPRWSFALNLGGFPGPDFSRATVTMTSGGSVIPVTMLPIANGYGDNTIAWEPAGLSLQPGMADRNVTVTIDNVVVGGATRSYRYTVTIIDPAGVTGSTDTVQSPANHTASVEGARVTLRWNPPVGGLAPTAYRLHVGTRPGESNLGTVNFGAGVTVVTATDVPDGTYYSRIVSMTSTGTASGPSNEAAFTIQRSACAPLAPPANVSASVSGRTVTLSWATAPGAASYIVEAGSASSLSNVFNANVGVTTSVSGAVPPGAYFIRVRSVNSCGQASPASTEVVASVF